MCRRRAAAASPISSAPPPRPLVIPDALRDPRVSPTVLAAGHRSVLGVPLRVGERVLGVLYVNRTRPARFADHEVNLLQIFANQAAVAIENARLFEERGPPPDRDFDPATVGRWP